MSNKKHLTITKKTLSNININDVLGSLKKKNNLVWHLMIQESNTWGSIYSNRFYQWLPHGEGHPIEKQVQKWVLPAKLTNSR